MSNNTGFIEAFVDSIDDELVLDTEEYGLIYMGNNIDHELSEGQTVWIDVVDRDPNKLHHHDYEVGQAYKRGFDEPKIVYVSCKEFRTNDQSELH